MPELPEVETIRLGLQKYLVGHVIKRIDVRLSKMFLGDPKNAEKAKVTAARRFGKGLVIDLDNAHSIAVHVKMTGQLLYTGKKVPKDTKVAIGKIGKVLPNSATHVIFHLDEGAVLYYNDIRQFGWVKLVKTIDVAELPFFKGLGPEPFRDLDYKTFRKILSSKKSPIKPLLMDQKIISGVGNIYANEALYTAKIHPKRPASSLTETETRRLFDVIEAVLKKGLAAGGSSEWQYVNALGEEGSYQKIFQIYGQDGKKCKNCGATIEKFQMSGRGTFFCPVCQL